MVLAEPNIPSDATERLLAAIEAKTGLARRRAGREWKVRCPVHDDQSPSLNVREGDTGYPIATCRVCGAGMQQIIDEVGLAWADIYPPNELWTPHGTATAVYRYVDEAGLLLYEVLRAPGKQFPCRRPDPAARTGWDWHMGDRRVIYRLPQVLEVGRKHGTVYVVEGEKDVETLEGEGAVATCNPGGAGKWREEYAVHFAGAHVIVIADLDPPGVAHARQVAATLQGIAATVKIMQPAVDVDKADVTDHIRAGKTLAELQPLGLEVVETQVPDLADQDPDLAEPPRAVLIFLPGPEFVDQPTMRADPLVGQGDDALMMPGSLGILAGVGGAGKTTLVIHAMAHWASGLPWFGIATPRPIRMIVIENEGPHDPYVVKIRQFADRFHDCPCGDGHHGTGRDWLANVLFLDAPWGRFTFDDQGLANELRDAVKAFNADLVVANPLGRLGMKGAGTPEETRAFLELLFRAGLNEDFAALLNHHMSKIGRHVPIVQQLSGDWGPHPDLILALEPDGERKSKLTFGKVRWGDQGRPPLLLEWLTDPDGPIGYTGHSAPQGITDEEVYERIDAWLVEKGEPQPITAIRTGVSGNAGRIAQLVRKGAVEGRYVSSGGPRPTFRVRGFDDDLGHELQTDLFEEEDDE